MNTQVRIAAIVAAILFLASCGHSTIVPVSPNRSSETVTLSSGTGTFVQYSLPADVNPADLARGPYGTIWFQSLDNPNQVPGIQPKVYQLVTATGAVHKITVPNPSPDVQFIGWAPGIIGVGRAIWFLIAQVPGEPNNYIASVTPEGVIKTYSLGVADSPFPNLIVGPDGRIWFTQCLDDNCSEYARLASISTSGVPGPEAVLAPFAPKAITPGPGGNLYVAGTLDFSATCGDCGAVDVASTAGVELHQFVLPPNSDPAGIVTGADHNLWITERGLNKVARMTPTGVVTQFTIPTANAGLNRITSGWDNALWFTESNANKIGRITTTGSVTEYAIPLANAFPTGIVTCASTSCPPNGGVWFTETKANKIAKFIAP